MIASIEDNIIYSPYKRRDIPLCSVYTTVKACLGVADTKLAAVDYAIRLTRAELLKSILRFAAGFQGLGITIGDRVCVHLRNSVENFIAVQGVIFTGATIILAKTSLTERELHYQLNDSDATHVLTDPQNAQKVLGVAARLKLKGLLSMGEDAGFTSVSGFANLDENQFKEVSIADPENTVIGICYTGGISGLAKGVEITHRSFVSHLFLGRSVKRRNKLLFFFCWRRETERQPRASAFLGAAAPRLCAGFQAPAEMALCHPFTFVFFRGRAFYCSVDDPLGSLYTGGYVRANQPLKACVKILPNTTIKGTLYTTVFTVSANISPALPEHHTAIAIAFLDIDTKERVGPYTQGELVFRSPTTMRGYYKQPKATAEVLEPSGWCRSGDLGFYDTTGRIHFVRRMKDMIKCMDNQVVPAELEDIILRNQAGVADVAVVGLPHPEYGEAAAAFVLPKDVSGKPPDVSAEDVKRLITQTCSKYKQLFGGVYFVRSLPRTETGKIMKSALIEAALQ
ncbi:unnamed protein product [Ixodes hexagonus]